MRLLLLFFISLFAATAHVAAGEVVLDFAHPKYARLDAEGRNLLSEYAKIYPKIRDFYENLRMDVTVKEVHNPSEESLQLLRSKWESEGLDDIEIKDRIERYRQSELRYELRHRLSDAYSRVDRIVNHRVTPSIRAKLPSEFSGLDVIPEVTLSLFTPTMGYQLSKNDPSRQYFSLNVRQDFRRPNVEGITTEAMYFDMAPFCSGNTSLEEILFQTPPLVAGMPYRVIEYVRQKDVAGEQMVEIRLVTSMRLDSNPNDIHGRIRLCRDLWVVKETFARTQVVSLGDHDHFGEIGWISAACTYDGIVDGIPLLKTYQRSEGAFDPETQEETTNRKILYDITQIIPGPPDLSEFDVAQFLQPGINIGEITRAQLTPGRIAAIAFGIILIILGIYLKVRSMRKRQTTLE